MSCRLLIMGERSGGAFLDGLQFYSIVYSSEYVNEQKNFGVFSKLIKNLSVMSVTTFLKLTKNIYRTNIRSQFLCERSENEVMLITIINKNIL